MIEAMAEVRVKGETIGVEQDTVISQESAIIIPDSSTRTMTGILHPSHSMECRNQLIMTDGSIILPILGRTGTPVCRMATSSLTVLSFRTVRSQQ